jgi:DNA-binding PadR family transcriptional regulator
MKEFESLLPLKPDVFLILTIVARGEQYGYGIMQEAEQVTDGQVRLQPGALYRRLRWMLDEGLLKELAERPVPDSGDDERRRYYGVTKLGREVARAEAARMRGLLRAAEGAGVLEGK